MSLQNPAHDHANPGDGACGFSPIRTLRFLLTTASPQFAPNAPARQGRRRRVCYSPNAISPKGAQGVMQLIPATARRFGVLNTFDAEENVQAGVRYLRFLLDYSKTVAAYNAGEGAVDMYSGILPYSETRNYVNQAARNLAAARRKGSLVGNSTGVAKGNRVGSRRRDSVSRAKREVLPAQIGCALSQRRCPQRLHGHRSPAWPLGGRPRNVTRPLSTTAG